MMIADSGNGALASQNGVSSPSTLIAPPFEG
jgi:hypothetical protein